MCELVIEFDSKTNQFVLLVDGFDVSHGTEEQVKNARKIILDRRRFR